MATQRYDKTPKGHDEITQGRKNLKGKLRTVLFLVDAGKDVASIQQQITLIGAPPDAIAQLATAGYIAPIGGPLTPTNDSVAVNGSSDPVASFRVAAGPRAAQGNQRRPAHDAHQQPGRARIRRRQVARRGEPEDARRDRERLQVVGRPRGIRAAGYRGGSLRLASRRDW